jgi:hypothetical protein
MTPPVPDDRGCLEGETLAAWHEGTLTASDVEAVDRHLADCARCQDLLAAFVRTDVAVAAPDPVGDSLWRRWRLAWLVPVATAATATAIWVAIPDRASVTRPPTSASDRAATSEPQARAAPGERGVARQQAETDVPEAGAEDPGAALERAAAGPPSRAERAAPAAPAEAPADTAASSVPSSADRDAELRRRESPEAFADEAGAAQERSRQDANAPASLAVVADATDGRAREIASPNPAMRWRITDGRVERSTDGGSSWEATTGVEAPGVVAGAAPGASVCWLVGPAGAVYLSTDGRVFASVPFPEAVDLADVSAVDERAATVTAADGRAWRTTDGGRTWVAATGL